MKYLKVWTSFREDMSALGDAEKGRLFVAMLEYAENGEEPTISGNERFIWPIAKKTIDLLAKRAEQLRENGEKGGRPTETKENQTEPNETKENQNGVLLSPLYIKDKDKYKDKEKDKDKDNGKGVYDARAREISQIVDLLNEKAGTKYRANTDATKRHINARLAEGYTVDDFQTVIDKKCAEWLGTDMEKFLRPETLFGSKFESYLNAPAHTGGKWKSNDPFGDMLREHEARMNAVEVEAEVYDF